MADAEKNMTRGERLMAEMAQKYGGNVASSSQPQVSPQVAPQVAPTENPEGILSGIKGIYGAGRKEKIDKAAGYNRGGKISGKGTPTSDSIPATVRESGENILVSDKERILSEAQDELVEGMAKKLGFKSLDAMLEAGTGIPVGPTMKDGKRAAFLGMRLDNKPDEYSNAMRGVMNLDAIPVGVGAGQAPTIYENGGLDPATVSRGIETMRAQLNSPSATPSSLQATPAPSDPASPSAFPATSTAQDQPPKSALAMQEAASKFSGGAPSMASGPTVTNSTGEAYTPEKGLNPLTSVVNLFKDSAQAARSGVNYNDVKAARISAEMAAAQPNAAEGNSLVPGATQNQFAAQNPFGPLPEEMPVAASAQSGKSINLGPNDGTGGGFTADSGSYNVNKTSQPGVQRVTGSGKSPLYTNINPISAVSGLANQSVGSDAEGLARMANENNIRGEMIANRDKDIPEGGYAAGILGDGGIAADNAEKTARWRQDELVRLASRGNQAAVAAVIGANARSNDVAGTNAANLQATEIKANADRYGHKAAAQRYAGHDNVLMRGQDITGANESERNKILAKSAEAKLVQHPIAVPGGEVADPSDPMGQRKLKLPSSIYDPNTGRWVSQPQAGTSQQGGAPSFATPAEVSAAKAAGKIKSGDIISTPNGLIKVS